MNLISLFITRAVRPGTSFAATPTLSMFKELYKIATRLVERVSPQSSQKTTDLLEDGNSTETGFISLSQVQSVPDGLSSFNSRPFPARNQQSSLEPKNIPTTNSATYSPDPNDDSPLGFAPFLPPEMSQFEHDPTIFGSLLSPTGFEWDMDSSWMPSFALDSSASGDAMGAPSDANVDFGQGSFDEKNR